jgi:radical SAM protein with 4Fe4S-binding SPASM domain
MEVKEYTDWVLGIRQSSVANRTPVRAAIEVTHRCNNNCVQCYNNLPLKDQKARRKELTFEEHCRILDQISALGCLWLLFTGGEIFARKDFLDIYKHAKQKGLLITLFTNGTLITPEIADYLVQYRPFAIEITLYGRTQQTYEQVTGIPGSFARCMQGIRLLMERELPLKLKSMAITSNKHELWDMKRFVEDELGLEFKFDAILNPRCDCSQSPRCDCSQSPLEVRLAPEEVVKLDLQDPERIDAWRDLVERNNNSSTALENSKAIWQCSSGLNTFAIDPYGMLHMCVLSQNDGYDLRNGKFQEGWEQFLYKLRQKEISKETKCLTCVIRDMCGMCPANAGLESLDEEEPVDFLCQVAHLRAFAFDISVPPHGDCEYCEGGSRYQEIMRKVKKLKQD